MAYISEDIESVLKESETIKNRLFQTVEDALSIVGKSNIQSQPIPGHSESINEIHARFVGFLNLSNNITASDVSIELVSIDYLQKFQNSVQNINSSQTEIINSINNLNGTVAFDESNFVLSGTNNSAYAIGQSFINLDSIIDRALERYYLISPALKIESQTISNFTSELNSALDQINKVKADSKKQSARMKMVEEESIKIHENLQRLGEQATSILNDINKNSTSSNGAALEIRNQLQSIQELLVSVKTTQDIADILKAKINNSNETLDSFDAEMSRRIKASEEGQKNLTSLISGFEKLKTDCKIYCDNKKTEIETIIKKAEEMLGLATSAGLATIFQDQALSRGRSINFHYGVIVFCAATIGLTGLWAAFQMTNGFKIEVFAIKIAIIVPLAFLIALSVKTMRKLEKSKEHYEHKTSVSYAVEGYRKLYDGDDQETEKSKLINDTIKEVLKDPTDGLTYSNNDDESVMGVLERFADIFVKILKEKK